MIWIYLLIGVANYAVFALRGCSMLFSAPHRDIWAGLAEMLFNVALWPVQVLFWLLVGLHNGTGWVLEKIMG